jgi:hypothetical protein
MFPMLSADELHDLAESIKTEGQQEAIVLSANGVLLDGRNHMAACAIAGVEPRFTTYSSSDPKGLILAHTTFSFPVVGQARGTRLIRLTSPLGAIGDGPYNSGSSGAGAVSRSGRQ